MWSDELRRLFQHVPASGDGFQLVSLSSTHASAGTFYHTIITTDTAKLDYHLYTSPLPHITNPPLSSLPNHSFFIPDDIRRTLQARHDATYTGTATGPDLGIYHSLVRLGPPTSVPSKVYTHPAPVYRAVSSVDGNVYAIRRIEGDSSVLWGSEHAKPAVWGRVQAGQRGCFWSYRYVEAIRTSQYRHLERSLHHKGVQR